MRFPLDRNLDVRLGSLLVAEWHDDSIVGIDAPATTPDDTILQIALAERRNILTENRGFGERVIRHRSPNPGIILYRPKNASLQERFSLTM